LAAIVGACAEHQGCSLEDVVLGDHAKASRMAIFVAVREGHPHQAIVDKFVAAEGDLEEWARGYAAKGGRPLEHVAAKLSTMAREWELAMGGESDA
jgi:hypothetical protein